ncbi:MAG: hypothetical protein ABIQ47_14165 [Tepidiformaceae bacterium]
MGSHENAEDQSTAMNAKTPVPTEKSVQAQKIAAALLEVMVLAVAG